MIGLLRKASFFYCTHLMTFSLIGVVPSLEGKYGAFLVMAAVLTLWMSSAVLWAEKSENYRFLRVLPITNREIATLKFSIIFATGIVGLGIISTYIFIAGERGGSVSTNLATAAFGSICAILIAYCWQICCWRFGMGIMTPIILVSLFLQFLLVMLPLIKRRGYDIIGRNEIPFFQALTEPFWFLTILALFGAASYGLWQLGIRTFEESDPD